MSCVACGRTNPPGNAFCGGCGARLALLCTCGHENPPDHGFCGRCGAALAPQPPPRVGPAPEPSAAERRQLTVLFCDLVDSTRLAAGMDAEDWRALVQRYHAAAGEVVARFEGHVAQYLGDGLLAYFGWPKAHEDDAERAVRAGLGIVQAVGALGSGFAVRVGIHTGPVVVGEIGGAARRETLALGDTTNLAARLQGVAEPDTVVMSAGTLRLVSGIFVTHDRGTHELKGIADPVRVHEAIRPSGVRSRLDVVAAGDLTPLVGRDQELMLLEDRFAQVVEGRGHAVLIQGEAGIGKSRLVAEFRARIVERGHTWLECRASPYTQDSALHPVLELVRLGVGVAPEDGPAAKIARIEAQLGGVGFDLARSVPIVAALFAVELPDRYPAPNLSAEALRARTLALLADWLLRLGREQPVVLLMEDLHWMDPSTLELLGQVLEQIPTVPVLLLGTYRPDFEQPWGQRSHLTPMLLARMTRAQLVDLVRKAARGRDLPDAWVDEIIRRSDGVPLFAEELTRTLLDQSEDELPADGTLPVHIPETLQDSLMARLDALGPVKELAQVGSVLGREFSYDLLLKVSPLKEAELQEALRAAVREELFYQRGTPPEATYLFKHALIRDAAYQSMLRATRQRHHRRVAETLIERLPEVAATRPELVAHHWTEASDAARAIGWWQRAGESALARSANREATRHFERGISRLAELPQGEARTRLELPLQVGLGSALSALSGWATTESEQAWRRGLELAEEQANEASHAAALGGLARTHQTRSELAEGLRYARDLRDLGMATADLERELGGWQVIISCHLLLGELESAVEALDRCLERDPNRELAQSWLRHGFDVRVIARSWGAWALAIRGRVERALALSAETVTLARRLEHPISLCVALTFRCGVLMVARDAEEFRRSGDELARLGEEQATPVWHGVGRLFRAWARAVAGEEAAHQPADSLAALGIAGSTGNLAAAPFMMWCHVDTLRLAGRHAEAVEFTGGALAISAQIRQPFYEAELHRLRGELLLAAEGHSEADAEASVQRALEIARSQGAKSFELRAATSLARLMQRQGRRRDARELLAPVYGWFTEAWGTLDLIEAKALLDELG